MGGIKIPNFYGSPLRETKFGGTPDNTDKQAAYEKAQDQLFAEGKITETDDKAVKLIKRRVKKNAKKTFKIMAQEIGEQTKVTLDLKTIGTIVGFTIALATTYFTLKSDIAIAMTEPKPEISSMEFIRTTTQGGVGEANFCRNP